jgi:hypothetical protein
MVLSLTVTDGLMTFGKTGCLICWGESAAARCIREQQNILVMMEGTVTSR